MRRAKDLIRKKELFNTYKTYKNKILKLTRLSKANHFNRFFIENKTKSGKVLNLLLIQNRLKLNRVSQPYESTIKLFQTKKI